MTWQQRALGVVMLAVLTLAPATATLCAITCHDDTPAAAHCHEDAGSSSQLLLQAEPAHDCDSHAAVVAEIAAPPQLRLALAPLTPTLDHLLQHTALDIRGPASLIGASSAPPGSTPPTTIPSVLRV